MKELMILQEVMPVITSNFEEVKSALSETLEKYKNLVVTDETLAGCKATQKELAGVRTKIDSYRKEKKKAFSEPIIAFENEMKELIALVEKAEAPILAGIKVFDDVKRLEKKAVAERLIAEVVLAQGLSEKYAGRLTVNERYCNLTAKEIDVKQDLEQRAFALKIEQGREEELHEIILEQIFVENNRLETKLSIKDFQRLLDRGMTTKDILAEIKLKADTIYQAENRADEKVVDVAKETQKEPMQEVIDVTDQSMHFANYRIVGTEAELKGVSQYLKSMHISYAVIEQGEI